MKLNLLGSTLLLCFEAVNALYPANTGQIQHFNNDNHQFIRLNTDQKTKYFNVTLECSGPQCKKVSDSLDKLTNTLSSFIQIENQINIKVNFWSFCERNKLCNVTSMMGFGKLLQV
jgi:hypothetical protein